jgi:hypothetical protein
MKNWTVLLLAPPASGKSHMMLELLQSKPSRPILFLSPLRAIGEEMAQKAREHGIDACFYTELAQLSDYQFVCISVERFTSQILAYYQACQMDPLVVLDEFHLFYYWQDFRYLLEEVYLELLQSELNLILLSATMKKSDCDRLTDEHNWQGRELYLIDHGNFTYKYMPKKYYYHSSFLFYFSLYQKLTKNENCFLYLPYRHQVHSVVKAYNKYFNVLGCVGGEVSEFRAQLASHDKSKTLLIAATSCLSHGVNLPSIRHVFLFTTKLDPAMQLQIETRGGRDGSGFVIHYLDSMPPLKPLNLIVWLKNLKYLSLLKVTCLLNFTARNRCKYLKQSFYVRFPLKKKT